MYTVVSELTITVIIVTIVIFTVPIHWLTMRNRIHFDEKMLRTFASDRYGNFRNFGCLSISMIARMINFLWSMPVYFVIIFSSNKTIKLKKFSRQFSKGKIWIKVISLFCCRFLLDCERMLIIEHMLIDNSFYHVVFITLFEFAAHSAVFYARLESVFFFLLSSCSYLAIHL
jgi:hypothetical protein